MIEKFDPFEAFRNNDEKKEEILYIEPINLPFKHFEVPIIGKLNVPKIDSFKESHILRSLKVIKNINNLNKFEVKNIDLN